MHSHAAILSALQTLARALLVLGLVTGTLIPVAYTLLVHKHSKIDLTHCNSLLSVFKQLSERPSALMIRNRLRPWFAWSFLTLPFASTQTFSRLGNHVYVSTAWAAIVLSTVSALSWLVFSCYAVTHIKTYVVSLTQLMLHTTLIIVGPSLAAVFDWNDPIIDSLRIRLQTIGLIMKAATGITVSANPIFFGLELYAFLVALLAVMTLLFALAFSPGYLVSVLSIEVYLKAKVWLRLPFGDNNE